MQDSTSTPAAGTRHRDGLAALLGIGAIAAILVLGYRPGPPIAEPAAAIASIGTPVDKLQGAYDLNIAMTLAGRELPPGTDSYYFFAFVEETPAEQEIAELAEKLQQASKEHDFLGITGPDAERNRRNLLSALSATRGRDLGGVVIIYLGPPAHKAEIGTAVKAAGAQLRFIAYPGDGPQT